MTTTTKLALKFGTVVLFAGGIIGDQVFKIGTGVSVVLISDRNGAVSVLPTTPIDLFLQGAALGAGMFRFGDLLTRLGQALIQTR